MHIVEVPITDLNPAPYNPRQWNEKQKNDLKKSIQRFGIVDPILVNGALQRKNIVIGGHFRLAMAKELGYTTVPIVYVDIPSIAKEKELNLRLNRNQGEWDMELLKAFDTDLLLNVGFDDTDLSRMWDDALETEDDCFDIEKELAKITKPKTKLGDLYTLGENGLVCGNATDPAVIRRLFGNRRADMIYTDPPFNIALDYDRGISNRKRYGGKTHDRKSDEEYAGFLRKALQNGLSVAKPHCHVFTYCDQRYIWLFQTLYRELGIDARRVCLWIKNNANMTPQIAFNKGYEPCVYGTRGKPYLSPRLLNLAEILNKGVGSGNRAIDDILDLLDIWLVRRLPGSAYTHPTEKPPTLHERPLRRCSKAGDTILDLFGGSGSTLVACHQMRRRAFLCEIEPIFCDLIIRRFEALTGTKASLLKA